MHGGDIGHVDDGSWEVVRTGSWNLLRLLGLLLMLADCD